MQSKSWSINVLSFGNTKQECAWLKIKSRKSLNYKVNTAINFSRVPVPSWDFSKSIVIRYEEEERLGQW